MTILEQIKARLDENAEWRGFSKEFGCDFKCIDTWMHEYMVYSCVGGGFTRIIFSTGCEAVVEFSIDVPQEVVDKTINIARVVGNIFKEVTAKK